MRATTCFTCRWPEVSLFKKQEPHQLLKKEGKGGDENKDNTRDWTHRRAPAAPVLYADLYNFVNLDLFRSRIMED